MTREYLVKSPQSCGDFTEVRGTNQGLLKFIIQNQAFNCRSLF
jgi:hypothetical protein